MNIEIYVVTHKKYRFPTDNIYKPIVAGAANYSKDTFPIDYIKDNSLDNISEKHNSYSEFTVVFWIWKNGNSDIKGINHYRRYFISGGWATYLLCLVNPKIFGYKYILSKTEIEHIFSNGYNCILPKKQWRNDKTLEEQYSEIHSAELLSDAGKVIQRIYPKYENSLSIVLASKGYYQKCICLMTNEIFDEYARWLFTIFSELEIGGHGKIDREFAFLAERLMNVWVEHNKTEGVLKVKENFLINLEYSFIKFVKRPSEYIIPQWIQPLRKVFQRYIINNNNKNE